MTDLATPPEFDVTVPLTRRREDGLMEWRDVKLRIPAANPGSAQAAAQEIAYAIVSHLPKGDDNNRHGWKIAYHGASAQPAVAS